MRAVTIFLSALGVGAALFAAPATAQTAPWLQVPPNKKDAVPAFKEQTRAPPLTSSFIVIAAVCHPLATSPLKNVCFAATASR